MQSMDHGKANSREHFLNSENFQETLDINVNSLSNISSHVIPSILRVPLDSKTPQFIYRIRVNCEAKINILGGVGVAYWGRQ